MLSFSLLGQVLLSKNEASLHHFRSQKEAALLIYLAQTGEIHQRDFIAELLWDARSTQQALSNLRTVLARLRKQVGDDLLITRKTVALVPENQQQVDSLNLLQRLTNIGQIDSVEKAATLQKTLDTYRGDFLADFSLPNASRFTDWMVTTREHIRRQVIAAYHQLGQYARSTGDLKYGIAVTRRWLQLDALDETAHTLLIQLLLEAGNKREAVAQYDNSVALLRTELGVEPSAKVTALIKGVRPKRVVITPPTTVRHNLPPPHDQFFGRKVVQEEIHVRLDQPWCRVVTMTGQGGVGKTRLATAIARSRLSQYQDGVWLVELADLESDDDDLAEAIAVEIAIALDLRLTGSAKPIEQLLNHLQHKQMTLILDNFEHLLGGTQIVLDIVQRCENVQLVVTSREPLRIQAEWAIALTGLDYPVGDMDETPSDAVELFVARWAQQRWGMLSVDEMAAVREICQMVEGLPLAIELAAALTRRVSPRTIAGSLHDGFDALTASLRDVPQRHRGLNVVFEMSWRTLTPVLQLRLARLSLFRGGFTQTAVSQITATTPQQLAALCEKSLLLFHEETDRYTIHPVIRTFATKKRSADDPTPQKHAHYYLTLLAQHTEPLQKKSPQVSISVFEPDIDNVRRAWQTGLAERNADLLLAALTSLSIYYQLRGLAHEGESVMQSTVRSATEWGADGIALAIRARLEWARFQNRLGQYRLAIQTLKTMLKLAAQCADLWAEGMGNVWWGEALWRLGKYDTAKKKLTKALNIAHDLDATLIIGWCHHQLGIIDDIQSRYDTAHDHLQQACAAWRTLDNTNTLSVSFNSLGLVHFHWGDLPAAQRTLERSLTLCSQIDNRHLQSFLLNNLSIITTDQGDFLGAQYYLQLGLELASSTGNLTGQGQLHINLGRNHRLLGEFDLSIASLEKGLQIAKSLGNQSLIAVALLNLANTKSAQENLEQAIPLYNQALALAQQGNLPSVEYHVLFNMAELLSINDTKQAQKYSLQAVELAESIKSPDLLERANTLNQKLHMSEVGNEKSPSE